MAGLMKPSGSVSETDGRWDDPGWVAEMKLDGFSGSILFGRTGKARMFKVGEEVTDNLPELICPGLAGYKVHVEWCAGSPIPTRELVPHMLCGAWHDVPDPTAFVIDVAEVHGETPENNLRARFPMRDAVVDRINRAGWPIRAKIPEQVWGAGKFTQVKAWAAGGVEGAVLKHLESMYTPSRSGEWKKWKKTETIDVAVLGYCEGGGKYAGMVGSLKLFLKKANDKWHFLGTASGMCDSNRIAFKEQLDRGEHFVAEIRFDRWSTTHGLLHPRFMRVREDKNIADCTFAEQAPKHEPKG